MKYFSVVILTPQLLCSSIEDKGRKFLIADVDYFCKQFSVIWINHERLFGIPSTGNPVLKEGAVFTTIARSARRNNITKIMCAGFGQRNKVIHFQWFSLSAIGTTIIVLLLNVDPLPRGKTMPGSILSIGSTTFYYYLYFIRV